jgi:hypothetical protein
VGGCLGEGAKWRRLVGLLGVRVGEELGAPPGGGRAEGIPLPAVAAAGGARLIAEQHGAEAQPPRVPPARCPRPMSDPAVRCRPLAQRERPRPHRQDRGSQAGAGR